MRLLIVGGLQGQIGAATKIAMDRGAKVTHAVDIDQAMAELRNGRGADLVLADVTLDIGRLVRALAAERICTPVVAAGVGTDARRAVDAIRAGAKEYLPLPPDPELIAAVLAAVADESHQLIHEDEAMAVVIALADQVAPSDASILITGESGTGKEVLARYVHRKSLRAEKPFISVNCAAIPENLLESELFGHEKGAFTGTVGAREGYFEQAGDGTLFLDEIGDLSMFTQVKLLRVLQQMEFSRLGSNKLIPLRARLIFATHRDLDQLVAEGKFRQDLFYRINVMRIESPPLQEHPEDIPQIAGHFLRVYSQTFQKPMESIEKDAMHMLQSYPWPGNVRELENVMQRAIILAPGKTVRAEDMNLAVADEDGLDIEGVVNIGDYNPAGSFERQLRDYKVKLAVTAVRESKGNKTLAARSLSISRAYLHRLIRLADTDPSFDQDLRETVNA
jgi:DNA-binding NtrC family response regulator